MSCLFLREDDRLREQEWGNFQEEHLSLKIEKERYKYGTFFYRMPYGESGADVLDRVSTFLDTMHRDFKKVKYPFHTIIVSHGLTIKTFLKRWFHWSVEEFEDMRTPRNCQIIKMELKLKQIESYGLTEKKYMIITKIRKRSDKCNQNG